MAQSSVGPTTREGLQNWLSAVATGVLVVLLFDLLAGGVFTSVTPSAPVAGVVALGTLLGVLTVTAATAETAGCRIAVVYLGSVAVTLAALGVASQRAVVGRPVLSSLGFLAGGTVGAAAAYGVTRLDNGSRTLVVLVWLPTLIAHVVVLGVTLLGVIATGRLRVGVGLLVTAASVAVVHRQFLAERSAVL